MDSYNKISIFAENATESETQQSSNQIGYFYPDTTWAGSAERLNGAFEGIAYSINYNTAIRQATFMSAVLAEVMAKRNAESGAYTEMAANGIGTTFNSNVEQTLDKHAENIAKIFDSTNFLMNGEVTTAKINNKAVTTAKVNDYAITYQQLGNVLGTKTASVNGITITLSQTSNQGQISIGISGNSVTNSDKVKIQTSTSKVYLGGSTSTSGYQNQYVNSSIYMQSGTLYTTNAVASGYVQADSFNATSDIRKKYDIYPVDHNSIKKLVEETQIQHFKYRDSEKDYIGIIAQDVLNNLNNSINNFKIAELAQDGYYTVSESKLVYVLWDYIQQLEKRVKELENK